MIRKNKYGKSIVGIVAVLTLLCLCQITVSAQGPQEKAMPGIQLLLFSEEAPPPPPPQPNIVFVTSLTYDGNLGGLAGADEKCQSLATVAGLPQNTYRAWLSTTLPENAFDRLGTARGWVRVDGKPFADTKADITARTIFHPLRVDENGAYIGTSNLLVWTGTQTNGTVSGNTCDNWTNNTNAITGTIGSSDGVAAVFTQYNSYPCNQELHLYCFGVDKDVPVTATPVSGRIAFVTSGSWTPSGGLSSADAQCQSEADNASLTGSFKALLATSTGSAQSRFEPIAPDSLPWVRPDGVAIAPSATELFTSAFLNTAINQSADGLSYYGFDGVWGGSLNPSTAGTVESTCTDWTSNSGNTMFGWTGFTWVGNYFWKTFGPCSMSLRLYCLQE